MRGHAPVTIEEFNGLYDRGDDSDCPLDHFRDCENIDTLKFGSGVTVRPGLGLHQSVAAPLGNIVRIHNYVMQNGYSLLCLVYNTATNDYSIYHVVNGSTVLGPILTKSDMEDFKCVSLSGRAYISPFKTYGSGDTAVEKGLQNEFLYVYAGDGTAARKAAGAGPDESMDLTISNAASGHTDAGLHTFGVCYEYDSGYLSPPGRLSSWTTLANNGVDFADIPVSGDSHVVARRIVASKVIQDFNGDTAGFQFFFIPDGRIPNNSATTLSNISFYDADLLDDASHLIDNFTEIAAGAALGIYHNRLCVGATYTDISAGWVSAPGEPEAINQITGLIVVPLDGTAITHFQELRDILWTFKRAKTIGYNDNGDDPSTWPFTPLDQAFGCPVHGVATVIDSGGVSADHLIVAGFAGVMIFNGQYSVPALTWKIEQRWFDLERNDFRKIQVVEDTIAKRLYLTLPNGLLLKADYSQGMTPAKIKWWPYRFDIEATTVAMTNINDVILGSRQRLQS